MSLETNILVHWVRNHIMRHSSAAAISSKETTRPSIHNGRIDYRTAVKLDQILYSREKNVLERLNKKR